MPSVEKQTALDWIKDNRQNLSDWKQVTWNYAEPACPKTFVRQEEINGGSRQRWKIRTF